MAENPAVPLNRIERVLAFMIATIGGLSVLAILSIIIATFSKIETREGIWLTIAVFPGIGLPVAFVLIIVFAILAITRRRRIAAGGSD